MDAIKANKLLYKGPCIFEGDPLKAILLNEISNIEDPISFDKKLDDISTEVDRKRILINGNRGRISRRFPTIIIDEDFPERRVANKLFCDNFKIMKSLLRNQSEISTKLLSVPSSEAVVLIVVDGLSYIDFIDQYKTSIDQGEISCEPILVDGITLTKQSIRRLIGNPTIARRMYEGGRKRVFGYNYWSRENDTRISEWAFSPIPRDNFLVYREFNEVLEDLMNREIYGSYFQIFMTGLDQISHDYRDKPPISNTLEEIVGRFHNIIRIFEQKQVRASVFLTSDHGILWKHGNEMKKLDNELIRDGGHRWVKGKLLREYLEYFSETNGGISCLKYPYITQNLGSNQWGVHGGISYEESVVPLIIKEVF